MKLFLFGGAETGEAAQELEMIESVILSLKPKQLLHIPFARVKESSEPAWQGDRFHRNISIPGIAYLNASNPQDIAKADNPVVFISGGSAHIDLVSKIENTPGLLDIIREADYIIGESAGSMVLARYHRTGSKEGEMRLLDALDILENAIIEPHYTQRNGESRLIKFFQESGVSYGIGIDTCTAMVLDLDTENFLDHYEKIGDGNIVVMKK